MPIRKLVFYLVIWLIQCYSQPLIFSQTDEAVELGSCVIISGQHKIASHWSIPTTGIVRHHDFFDHYEFGFFRTGISYNYNQSLQITLGIAYLDLSDYEPANEVNSYNQFWLYEEATVQSKLYAFTMAHRLRVENRWIADANGHHFNLRFRHRFQFVSPLYQQQLYAKVFNELFVNLNEPRFFNQNRFFIGLGTNVTKNIRLETGYLKNHFRTKHYNRFRVALLFSTDLRKKRD